MAVAEETKSAGPAESRPFEADVAKLLHLMVHSVYSDKSVFLRELIANAADACERLRYEAISDPALLGDDVKPRITVMLDAEGGRLSIEDNGIGMSRDEMIEALGTIARSGTKAFLEKIEAAQNGQGSDKAGEKATEVSPLIGRFGVGFYSAFMVAERVDVSSRRAGSNEAWQWSSDGKGEFAVAPLAPEAAPQRGTRVLLHLLDDAKTYAERATVEPLIKAQSGHVPVPIMVVDKPGAAAAEVTDGAALWAKPKSEIKPADYTDFYRGIAGAFDEPVLTIHYRAEGRQDYTTLLFVPGSRPFDLFDPDRKGRIKLYVKRVFITDDADILPRYLRFVRGLVDSADLPLNVSREKIQESPLLAAIRKGVTARVLSELERLADKERDTYGKIWDQFGAVLKEGLYEDFERRDALLKLARFKTTAGGDDWRSLADYAGALKTNQTAIYYITGDELGRLKSSPHLEGFRARGVEVLLLPDPVDTFWVMSGLSFEGKPFKSVTQGAADLALIPRLDAGEAQAPEIAEAVKQFLAFLKSALGDQVAEVRASERLTDSAVCLVAADSGPDRALEKILASAGRLASASKPILEVNPHHRLIAALAALGASEQGFKEDAAHLLFDEARFLEGDRPADAKLFSERLARVLERGVGRA
ncbi:MAG TPA: molecular chaperone HtpG [Xanthobacteraceae bacterium]|nr:molecular chaperone HtpG [Xanthobacteraceae bacterium]